MFACQHLAAGRPSPRAAVGAETLHVSTPSWSARLLFRLSLVAEFTYEPGIDQPLSVRRWAGVTAQTYYYATEEPGSVVGLVNTVGSLVATYGYSPYGMI